MKETKPSPSASLASTVQVQFFIKRLLHQSAYVILQNMPWLRVISCLETLLFRFTVNCLILTINVCGSCCRCWLDAHRNFLDYVSPNHDLGRTFGARQQKSQMNTFSSSISFGSRAKSFS